MHLGLAGHNNLLKHLPGDVLKIRKEILNNILDISGISSSVKSMQQMVIPIPKPNKDHIEPLSYRPIALTNGLCKVLERMTNIRFIGYLEKSRILEKSQCGFRKHHSTTDHLVSLQNIAGTCLPRGSRQFVYSLTFEKAYKSTWQYIIRGLHRVGLGSRLPCLFLSGASESESEWGQH